MEIEFKKYVIGQLLPDPDIVTSEVELQINNILELTGCRIYVNPKIPNDDVFTIRNNIYYIRLFVELPNL